MAKYWKRPQQTAETLKNGWLHTGDVARVDERGYMFILDRKKDMIVTGGFNVFPREVEDALATHPEHLELCWTRAKAIMRPGKFDMLTKEIIALAVSVTNSCRYCINSHTAAAQKLGLDNEGLGEVLAVVGLYNQMNKLADAYQVEPDILPVT